jgi:hypothetical protein
VTSAVGHFEGAKKAMTSAVGYFEEVASAG